MRLIKLERSQVVQAIRDQELSKTWTVDFALELALLGGLWEEACKFVADLGEWRKAILLAMAYLNHRKRLMQRQTDSETAEFDLARLMGLAHKLALCSIANLLGLKVCEDKVTVLKQGGGQLDVHSPQHCTEEVFHSITGTLQVCAAGGLDSVLVKLVVSLTRAVNSCSMQLPQTVHSSVYLPAPPLYCPQPSIPEEVSIFVHPPFPPSHTYLYLSFLPPSPTYSVHVHVHVHVATP